MSRRKDYTYCSKSADWTATDCTELLNKPDVVPCSEGCGIAKGFVLQKAPPQPTHLRSRLL